MSQRLFLDKPEHWRADSAGDSVVALVIPASLSRHRVFDIDVTLVVKVPLDGMQPWHELILEVDGRRQWSRRIFSSSPGQTDGLDYHCRVHLEAERALRVRASAAAQGSSVASLLIEAKEER
jgi:hypothetical protein